LQNIHKFITNITGTGVLEYSLRHSTEYIIVVCQLSAHLPYQCLKPAMSVSWQSVLFHLENRKLLLAAK